MASGVGAVALSTGVLYDVKFRVWRRGITCALACQKLAPSRGLDAEEAFLAGLLHGFGRSIAVASLEQLLKTHQPARPLSVHEWLSIAEQHRAALAHAVAQSWQLPPAIALAVEHGDGTASPLQALVIEGDRAAGELDAGRMPQLGNPNDGRAIDELVSALPLALEAFAPPPAAATMVPKPALAKPEHALDGELHEKSLPVIDKRAKGAATLSMLALAPAGVEVESSKPFQEGSVVRLTVGDPDAAARALVQRRLVCAAGRALPRGAAAVFAHTRNARPISRTLRRRLTVRAGPAARC